MRKAIPLFILLLWTPGVLLVLDTPARSAQSFNSQEEVTLKINLAVAAVGTLLAILSSQARATETDQSTVIPEPQKTDNPCHAPDHLPPVCEYKIYLTDEQFKSAQELYSQNVDKIKKFFNLQSK
jgi:hypothetical protein